MSEFSDETKFLRTLTGDPTPSLEQRTRARNRLDEELLADRYPSRGSLLRWMAFSVAFGALVVIAGFFLFDAASEAPQDLPVTLEVPNGRDSTESAYRLYVESVRTSEPLQVSEGTLIRTEQEVAELSLDPDGSAGQPVVVINSRRIQGTWTDGEGVLVTVQDPPVLYSSDPNSLGSGTDSDSIVGRPRRAEDQLVTTVNAIDSSDFPTDSASLGVALNALLDMNQQRPSQVQIFQLAEVLNTPSQLLSPSFRAALLEVLGALDVEQDWNADGTMSLTMGYTDSDFGSVAQTLTFDPNGYLVRSSIVTIDGLPQYGVPALSEIRVMIQSPPEIVNR